MLKSTFSKINKRGPNKVRGWKQFSKINKRGGAFIKHQRVISCPKLENLKYFKNERSIDQRPDRSAT